VERVIEAYVEPDTFSIQSATQEKLSNESTTLSQFNAQENLSYLDACVVYVPDDLDPLIVPKVKKLIRVAGGTIANSIDSLTTHCIISKPSLSQRWGFFYVKNIKETL
jgi:hypothetical protein